MYVTLIFNTNLQLSNDIFSMTFNPISWLKQIRTANEEQDQQPALHEFDGIDFRTMTVESEPFDLTNSKQFNTTCRGYTPGSKKQRCRFEEYKVVIEASKELESQLAELNAVGKGLHEKVISVQNEIPNELVKLLIRVATVRNWLFYEDFSLSPRQLRAFENWFEDAYEKLDVIINNETRREVHTRIAIETESNNLFCCTCGHKGEPTYIKEKDIVRYSCCAECSELLRVYSW